MAEKKYLDADGLVRFLANLINTFSEKNHSHTISEVSDCQSETWTFTLDDGSTVTKNVVIR